MKKYKLKLEVNSSLFIGDGNTLDKFDYYISNKNDYIYIIDGKKFIKQLKKLNYEKLYLDYIMKKTSVSKFFNDTKMLDKINIEEISTFKVPCNYKYSANNELNPFLRNGLNKIYVPGSSIKGAIANAIIHKKLMKLKETDFKSYNELFNLFKNPKSANSIEKEIKLRVFDDFKQYFKCIAVTDSLEVNNLQTRFVQKEEYTTKGSKINKLPIYKECLQKDTQSIHELTVYNDNKNNITYDYILEALDEFIAHQLEIYYYFEDKENKELISDIQNSNIILGGGGGFFNKTLIYSLSDDFAKIKEVQRGYWRNKHNYEKHDNILSPRTVKLSNKELMGLCTLSGEKYDL